MTVVEQEQDYLNELAELALGTRLKRLSDRLTADATKVYRAFGFDLQPKWFTLLSLLHTKGQVSVVNAAELLGLSQPAISQFSRDLVAQGIVVSTVCDDDSRKRQLTLSKNGKSLVKKLQPMWAAVDAAAKELCREDGNNFYQSLVSFERVLARKSLLERALEAHNGD